MATGYEITQVWGIPIKLHITLIIVLPFFLVQMTGMGLNLFGAALTVVLLFTSVALHELGHSRAAHRYGYSVREILLLPIGGVAMLEQMPRKPIEEFVIAIAGPAVSLVLAVGTSVLAVITGNAGFLQTSHMLAIAAAVNTMLCLFNLIPSFPMDGGRVFRAFMTPRVGRLRATYFAAKTGRIIAVVGGLLALFVIRPFSFSLVLIAIFIYYAAGAEYRGVLMQERLKQGNLFGGFEPFTPPEAEEDHGFSVGPAPYEQGMKGMGPNVFRRWFDDLFEDYEK